MLAQLEDDRLSTQSFLLARAREMDTRIGTASNSDQKPHCRQTQRCLPRGGADARLHGHVMAMR